MAQNPPQSGRSTNRRSNAAEPEVVFRITHVSLADGESCGDYREQAVEITLGPKAAFENGNVGVLTRRVPPSRVVNAVPPSRRKPRPQTPPKPVGPPPIVETLRKAIEWRCQLDADEVPSQAAIARREGITRARVTQIMALLRLSPAIQDQLFSIPEVAFRSAPTERVLRAVIALEDPRAQAATLRRLMKQVRHHGVLGGRATFPAPRVLHAKPFQLQSAGLRARRAFANGPIYKQE